MKTLMKNNEIESMNSKESKKFQNQDPKTSQVSEISKNLKTKSHSNPDTINNFL